MRQASIIIPTYNEAKNLKPLFEELDATIDKDEIAAEYIVVDDNSPDGTGDVARELSEKYPIRLISRSGKMGLGSAVREGFEAARNPILGVMDADLSHDPKIINELIISLDDHDLAIGSRFESSSMVEGWLWWRKAISSTGVCLARSIIGAKDALSGYFFFNRDVINDIVLETVGYKILLEILVKGKYRKIKEVPYTFRMRKHSASKLDMNEFILFLGQIIKYSTYARRGNRKGRG